MSGLDERTTIPFMAGIRGFYAALALVVIALLGLFGIREDVLSKISAGNAATAVGLNGIDSKITALSHRLDLFEQKVDSGIDDRWRKADMRLWIFQAKEVYPALPDIK